MSNRYGTDATPDRPEFEIRVGGTAVDAQMSTDVMEIDVAEEIGRHGRLTLLVQNWDADTRSVRHSDDGPFGPGAEVEVLLGYHSSLQSVFDGVVVAVTTHDRPFGRHLEDFEAGDVYQHWPGKTITEYDDHLFCMITMNHHPLHTNDWYAAGTPQGRNVVVGNLVYSLVLGMSVQKGWLFVPVFQAKLPIQKFRVHAFAQIGLLGFLCGHAFPLVIGLANRSQRQLPRCFNLIIQPRCVHHAQVLTLQGYGKAVQHIDDFLALRVRWTFKRGVLVMVTVNALIEEPSRTISGITAQQIDLMVAKDGDSST